MRCDADSYFIFCLQRLPAQINERNEKLKTEMLGKQSPPCVKDKVNNVLPMLPLLTVSLMP